MNGTLTGLVFVCSSCHSPWAYECQDGWHMPLKLTNSALNCSRKDLPGVLLWFRCDSFGRALLPQLGVNVTEAMIRNLSTTHEDIADFVAKTLATLFCPTVFCPAKIFKLSGQDSSWKWHSPWFSFCWARRYLCSGQHHLTYLDWHFWGSWNSVT